MNDQYFNKLAGLIHTLKKIEKLVPVDFTLDKAPAPNEISGSLQPKLKEFYSEVQRCFIEWKHKDFIDNPQVSGRVNLLPPQTAMGSWEGVVWFDQAPTTYGNKDFKIIDYFKDETVVGMYYGDKTECLYLFKMQGKPISLELDIEGYINMMIASLGFVFWQFAVLEILHNEDSPVSSTFKQFMPVLNPNFSWDEYCRVFKQNKL